MPHHPSQTPGDDIFPSLPIKNAARIIVFTRCPDPGQCKTRLISALGIKGATALHEAMIRRTLGTVGSLLEHGTAVIEIRYAGRNLARLRALDPHPSPGATFRAQQGEQLGERLHGACDAAFQEGCQRVVLIGTDCPSLKASHLRGAIQRLDRHDIVVGPAVDGGYYLLALRNAIPALFQDIPWGTERVLSATLEVARRLQLSTSLLPTLADIDRPEDLHLWPGERMIP